MVSCLLVVILCYYSTWFRNSYETYKLFGNVTCANGCIEKSEEVDTLYHHKEM